MNIEPIDKFNTCKHRSVDVQIKVIKRCSCQGGDYTLEGYNCEVRQIFQVTPDICVSCPVYESK